MDYIIEENTVDYSLSEKEHIIYHANSEKLIVVNHVAACIWHHLKSGKNIDEIILAISDEFKEKDVAKVRIDVLKFINQLSDNGLIKRAEK